MAKKLKKILVLNMTRMGDILQSTPLLKALKVKYEGAEISYFAVSGFAEICRYIPEIDRVIPFDFNAAVAVSKEAVRLLPRRLKETEEFIETLKNEHFDAVYNLSHSNISALLAFLIDAEETRGLTLNREGYRQIAHPWARYFFTANLNRHYNRINLVDINLGLSLDIEEFADGQKTSASPFGKHRLSFQITREAAAKARALLSSRPSQSTSIKIGLQPGASLDCKMWPAPSFARTAHLLHNKFGAEFWVLGSQAEADLAASVCAPLGNIATNLAGQTDIGTLGALLSEMDLLITNDTGTQHLAAAVGTPVLSLCFGSALSHETGPYGKNHIVMEADLPCYPCSFHVECNNYRCQQAVTPEAVFAVAEMMLSDGEGRSTLTENSSLFDNINIWRTDFDEMGFWQLRPVVPKPLEAANGISLGSRAIWQEILTASVPESELPETVDSAVMQSNIVDYFPAEKGAFIESIKEELNALQRLSNLAAAGQINCEVLKDGATEPQSDLQAIRSSGEALQKIDNEINLLGFRQPAVNHLVLDFNFLKQNLEGDDIFQLTQHTQALYRRLAFIASRLQNLLICLTESLYPRHVDTLDEDAMRKRSRIVLSPAGVDSHRQAARVSNEGI